MNKIENLKKVRLMLEAGTSADNMDLRLDYPEFEFIFGLGPTGMTPFEYELVDKTEAQEVVLQIKRESLPLFFEHLHVPIMKCFNERDEIFLNVKIMSIAPADHREVVKALADIAGHDHGCECGCGCSWEEA